MAFSSPIEMRPPSSSTRSFVAASCVVTILLSVLLLIMGNKKRRSNYSKQQRRLKLPPCPPGWPIVGNLFQVVLSGKPFIHYARDLIDVYGPIFTLRMGARTMIIISSAGLAHEALIEKGQQFASRPAENPTRTVFSCDKFTVNSAVYGPEWRSLRRNMVSGMLSATRLRDFLGARQSAMDRFVGRLRAEAEAEGGAVWVLRNARFAVFCILLAMCFGVEMDEESIDRVDQVMKRVLMTLNPRIDDYLPLLRPLFAKQRRHVMEVRREQIETIVPLIDARRAILTRMGSKEEMQLNHQYAPFSYLDSLLDLRVEGRESAPNDVELVTLTSEFLNGGTDTTATAVEWAIARIIENPSIQARLHEEIAAVVGQEHQRAVEEAETERMPYLKAFIKELLRRHPPTYFSLTHAAAEAGATLGGYDVPQGANLEIYLPTISEDPKLWRDPGAFDPERFLSGGESADMTGVRGIRMIPFGAGRRICPGLGMGITHITLMVARMVQAFEWLPHPSQPTIDLGNKLEFTVVMNTPLRAMVRPRHYTN